MILTVIDCAIIGAVAFVTEIGVAFYWLFNLVEF